MLRRLWKRWRPRIFPTALALAGVLILFLFSLTLVSGTQQTDNFYSRLGRGVVSISVERSGSLSEIWTGATGFLALIPGCGICVVTANHVVSAAVAYSLSLGVFMESALLERPTGLAAPIPMVPFKIVEGADVAVLKPVDPASFDFFVQAWHLEPYSFSTYPPALGDELYTLGESFTPLSPYSFDWQNVVIYRNVLQAGVAIRVVDASAWSGTPLVDLPFWKSLALNTIDGAPGFSGAPIFNREGNVVGLLVGHITGAGIAVSWADLMSSLFGQAQQLGESSRVGSQLPAKMKWPVLCAYTWMASANCP